jgi:putative ABC transport system permease protein
MRLTPDLRLGVRLLLKYPGLSIVGGLAMMVAIAFGTAAFAFFHAYLDPTLPLPGGDRIVALENWNVEVNNEERRAAHDLHSWRREMTTVQQIGAFRNIGRNLFVHGRSVEPIRIAEITATGFGVAGVSPLLGRPLVETDERPDAEPVLVVGYDAWQTRFGGDPSVIGREVRLGGTVHTIVGVMPERFAWPMNHGYWTPLRLDVSRYGPGEGPSIHVFGRLAPEATKAQAQAELTAIGLQHAAEFPDTHANLRPQVLAYTYPLLDIQDVSLWQVGVMQGTVSMLLVIVALNVAILVYARTATRQGEIAVRTALGASRSRIIGQLFIEALVLSAVSGVAGVLLARIAMQQAHGIMAAEVGMMPFWMDGGIPAEAVVYVVAVVVLAAVLAGVVPALQATRSQANMVLRQLGGSTGLQLGTTWTLLIVTQVGIAVAGLPVVVATGWQEVRQATSAPTFAVEEYMGVRFALDGVPAGADDDTSGRLARVESEMARRIEAEPSVIDVTTATALPGNAPRARIETDGASTAAAGGGHQVSINRVALDFFDAFDIRILAGRTFTAADSDVVVVNRTFADRVLGGQNVLGRRIRDLAPAAGDSNAVRDDRWLEIIGVVGDLYTNAISPEIASAEVYHPLVHDAESPSLIVRIRSGDPAALADRVREMATGIDADVRVGAIPLAQVYRQDKLALRLVALGLGAIVLSVLLLSAAGIYALVSFTVSRRRREIGIRAALGAEPAHLLRSIFTRAAGQIMLGVVAGLVSVAVLDAASDDSLLGGRQAVLLPTVSLLMLTTGLLALLGPARRALRIQPTEALRED